LPRNRPGEESSAILLFEERDDLCHDLLGDQDARVAVSFGGEQGGAQPGLGDGAPVFGRNLVLILIVDDPSGMAQPGRDSSDVRDAVQLADRVRVLVADCEGNDAVDDGEGRGDQLGRPARAAEVAVIALVLLTANRGACGPNACLITPSECDGSPLNGAGL
jgi:hypothetical protein